MKFACVSALLVASASAFSPANIARTQHKETSSVSTTRIMKHVEKKGKGLMEQNKEGTKGRAYILPLGTKTYLIFVRGI